MEGHIGLKHNRINCTVVELKLGCPVPSACAPAGINCTVVELKQEIAAKIKYWGEY